MTTNKLLIQNNTHFQHLPAQSMRSGADSTRVFAEVLDSHSPVDQVDSDSIAGMKDRVPVSDAPGHADPVEPYQEETQSADSSQTDHANQGKGDGQEPDPRDGRSKEKEAESARMARARRLRELGQDDSVTTASLGGDTEQVVRPSTDSVATHVSPIGPAIEPDNQAPTGTPSVQNGVGMKPSLQPAAGDDPVVDLKSDPRLEVAGHINLDKPVPDSDDQGQPVPEKVNKVTKLAEETKIPLIEPDAGSITPTKPGSDDKPDSVFPKDASETVIPKREQIQSHTELSKDNTAAQSTRAAAAPPAINAVLDRVATARSLVQSAAPITAAGSASNPAGVTGVSSASGGSIGSDLADSPKLGVLKQATSAARHDRSAVMAQVQRGLASILRTSGGSMTLRLSPGHLGDLKIRVATEDGGVRVRFETETAGAREAIEQGLRGLREQLETKGVRVHEMNVDHRDSNPFGSSNSDSNAANDEQDTNRQGSTEQSETGETRNSKHGDPQPVTEDPQAIWTDLGLDAVA